MTGTRFVEIICYFLNHNLESINHKYTDKMKKVCKRVGRFVYSEKQGEGRTQAIFPRELSVIARNSAVSVAY